MWGLQCKKNVGIIASWREDNRSYVNVSNLLRQAAFSSSLQLAYLDGWWLMNRDMRFCVHFPSTSEPLRGGGRGKQGLRELWGHLLCRIREGGMGHRITGGILSPCFRSHWGRRHFFVTSFLRKEMISSSYILERYLQGAQLFQCDKLHFFLLCLCFKLWENCDYILWA